MYQHLLTKMRPKNDLLHMMLNPRSLPDGTTAMHFAAERGNEELASFLAAGIEIFRKSPSQNQSNCNLSADSCLVLALIHQPHPLVERNFRSIILPCFEANKVQ